MKTWIALAAAATVLVVGRRARAAETPSDVETDHIDAADDAGPPTAAVLVDPIAMSFRQLGAEVDFVVGEGIALGIEGDRTALEGATVVRAALGAPFFPQRFVFHGLYLRPEVEWWMSAAANGALASALGAGVVMGYEWTAPCGATVRLGGGASYAKVLAAHGAATTSMDGLRPRLDASLGWVL
jgi:hypothetical protein